MDWTLVVWRLLCLLALMSALAAVSGLLFLLPSWMVGVAVLPGLLVGLLLVVSGVLCVGGSDE